MLAAISRDLRAPLTRMRCVPSSSRMPNCRPGLFKDVDEMQAMVDAAWRSSVMMLGWSHRHST
jgi:hypothetical protein